MEARTVHGASQYVHEREVRALIFVNKVAVFAKGARALLIKVFARLCPELWMILGKPEFALSVCIVTVPSGWAEPISHEVHTELSLVARVVECFALLHCQASLLLGGALDIVHI